MIAVPLDVNLNCPTGYRCNFIMTPEAPNAGVSQGALDLWPLAVMFVAIAVVAIVVFYFYRNAE